MSLHASFTINILSKICMFHKKSSYLINEEKNLAVVWLLVDCASLFSHFILESTPTPLNPVPPGMNSSSTIIQAISPSTTVDGPSSSTQLPGDHGTNNDTLDPHPDQSNENIEPSGKQGWWRRNKKVPLARNVAHESPICNQAVQTTIVPRITHWVTIN